MRRLIVGVVVVVALVFSVSNVLAQDACEGNFDYDKDVDGSDAAVFKSDFGRSGFNNPCPPYGPAPVEKTGQSTSYATGDDGNLEKGVPWPNPRFTDNLDGTVIDNLTGLIWLKDANCIATHYPEFDNDDTPGDGLVVWQHALDFVAGINDGAFPDCGAGNTDWRLPNANELASLVHKEYYNPALPNTEGTGKWSEGDPFTGVWTTAHWSSTSYSGSPGVNAWYVLMFVGNLTTNSKSYDYYVWPVRGGH